MTRRILLLSLGLACFGPGLLGETSLHERVGKGPQLPWEFSLDLDVGLRAFSETEGLLATADLGGGFLVDSRFGIALGFPFMLRLGGADPRLPRLAFAPGNPGLSFSWAERRGPWRYSLQGELGLALPSPPPKSSAGRGFDAGGGQAALGLGLASARYLDPLVLASSMSVHSLLPSAAGKSRISRPLSARLGLSLTEVLSGRASISLNVDQDFEGPTFIEGKPQSKGWRYSLEMRFSLFIVMGRGGLRFGFKGPGPAIFSAGASMAFRPKP